jgi:membrane protein implicated in regulation of membrane protease activity
VTQRNPLRALMVAAVGLLGLDAVLLILAGAWLHRAVLVVWGVALAALAVLPAVSWRRYVRQMDEVHGARHAMARELRHLRRTLRETPADVMVAGAPRR